MSARGSRCQLRAPALISKVVLPLFLLSVPTTHPALVSFRTIWPPRQPKRSASAIPPERHRIRDPDPLGLGGHRTSGPLSRPHLSVGSALRLWFALFDPPDFPLSFCLFLLISGGATKSGAPRSLQSRAGPHGAGSGKGAVPGEPFALPEVQLSAPRAPLRGGGGPPSAPRR